MSASPRIHRGPLQGQWWAMCWSGRTLHHGRITRIRRGRYTIHINGVDYGRATSLAEAKGHLRHLLGLTEVQP